MAPLPRLTPAAPLTPGMTVGVVAPAGPVNEERLKHGCAVLRSMGLDVRLGQYVLGRGEHGHLAARDRDRAADLRDAWCDPNIDAVFCALGGYGSSRILGLMDWAELRRATGPGPAKPLIGSSDITALHQAFATHLGVQTFYGPTVAGPVLGTAEPDEESLRGLRSALFGPLDEVSLSGGHGLVPGVAEGVTVGGNLAMLCSTAGTREFRPAADGIAVLEDVGEAPYRIDRMLTQLLAVGWFDGVRGVACGSWERCGNPERVLSVVAERLRPLGVPIVVDLPFGHGPVQLTVPLGAHAVLDAGSGTLGFLGGTGATV
ncbi:S66 peptidase family protein [Streptomyces sp. NPDC002076]